MKLLKRTTALLVVTLLLGAAGCNRPPSDASITGRVKTAISNEPGLKGTTVSVSTNEKVVHLRGNVKSRDERAMLIAVARKVDGVKAIKTDLVVAPQPDPGVKRQPKPGVKQTAVQARAKREPRAQIKVTPPGAGVPPER